MSDRKFTQYLFERDSKKVKLSEVLDNNVITTNVENDITGQFFLLT